MIHSRIGKILLKCLTKAIDRINAIPNKIPKAFFTQTETIFKFVWNDRRSRIAKAILAKMNKAGAIMFSDSKLYYKACDIGLKTDT